MYAKSMRIFLMLFVLLLISYRSISAGDVYLVIGSDTAIWEGMNTNRFHCFYNVDLYTNPQRNAYKVMDPAFRARLVDSDGQPLKMTWWMMAGNIFRYATNTNVPIPNIMTLYLMKTYHGNEVIANGDELSLHYHTFRWYDYDHDGIFYWNQALKFMDCFDDFNVTLAQYLLEEQVFPVSFRSGWHYMDNDWQHYLDNYILPYSLHNDYPHKHNDTVEPLDNIYDWSQAPAAFIPYRPSSQNYQIPGNGKGWNVRSAHFWRVIHDHLIDTVFAAAQKGQDQVACFWGHLPENDFITNIERLDSIAHARIGAYPDVKFYYCTATEAMQRWRKTTDSQPPTVDFSIEHSGDDLYFTIQTDEPIFQVQPFVAVKDIYENYRILSCEQTGSNSWRTREPIRRDLLAKAGVAVCDSLGNQQLKFIRLLPDDDFIDNKDNGFETVYGNWQPISSGTPWGTDALAAILNENDSVEVQWTYDVPKTTFYNVFVQIPKTENTAKRLMYVVHNGENSIDTLNISSGLLPNSWHYLKTLSASEGDQIRIQLKASGQGQNGQTVLADVVKISPLVRDRDLRVDEQIINFGAISWGDTAQYSFKLQNLGKESLTIKKIDLPKATMFTDIQFPFAIPAMSDTAITLFLHSETMGNYLDSLTIESNDPQKPRITLPVNATVENYFAIVDNEDAGHYFEFGEWHTSNAQAYGPSSRYAWLNQKPLAYATFQIKLRKSGVYELFEIVPKTVNATDKAIYEIRIDSVAIDSILLNQNEGSGAWVRFGGRYYFPADVTIEIRVIDSGQSTMGDVLRADAVKFSLIKEITDLSQNSMPELPDRFYLMQNFPNPFNATTTIRYYLPQAAQVQIDIFNVLGKKVRTLIDTRQTAGVHRLIWNGQNDMGETVSSGLYYYRLNASGFKAMKKMILLK